MNGRERGRVWRRSCSGRGGLERGIDGNGHASFLGLSWDDGLVRVDLCLFVINRRRVVVFLRVGCGSKRNLEMLVRVRVILIEIGRVL